MTAKPAAPLPSLHHIPVLCQEIVTFLNPRPDSIYVDATFGLGGYSRALLTTTSCRVIGIDRDPDAIQHGLALEKEFPGRFTMIAGQFSEVQTLLQPLHITAVDGICFDLGISSPQIDDPSRGFSFRFEGPLDMRMSQQGPSAADIVNTYPESELADILWNFGEERMSRRIARAIVEVRKAEPFTTTTQLAKLVRSIVPFSSGSIDPATRTFQALRIQVNNELEELKHALVAAEHILKPGGRLAVVSFHSLEDRMVKDFFRERGTVPIAPSRHTPHLLSFSQPLAFHLLTRRPVVPQAAEAQTNPRARSARLRVAERTRVPVSS